ncbi:TPA: hypothetical protein PXQ22_003692 [Yersinia enterocolitica]|nr:hypothetical protein [Yersinia enterocolitica]
MDITKSREAFEEWLKSRDCNPVAWLKDAHWEVWKAARESIVVELPKRQSLYASGYGDGYFVPSISGEGFEYDEVVEALRTAGIRIKGESE